MTYRHVYVRFADGTGRVVASERDDEPGRRATEREAFEWLSRSRVASVQVSPVRGRFQQGGSWR